MDFSNPELMNFLAYKSFLGTLLSIFGKSLNDIDNILNTYAPYSSRRYFLDKMESHDLLKMGSLILWGI